MGTRDTGSKRITKRTIDALRPGQIVWDTSVKGFGVRRRSTDARVYVLKYRFAGRQRWYTVGQHGTPWTVDQARQEARRLLGVVAAGRDPAEAKAETKRDLTVTELCDLYVEEGCATKKASTLATDGGRIARHIKPLLGRKRVRSITRGDVERFMLDVAAGKTATDVKTGPRGRAIVKGGKGAATKSVSLLGAIFSFAMGRALRPDNPVRGVKTYRSKRHERFLSPAELGRLGDALAAAEADGENQSALAAIRLLAMTGCRRSEILGLTWDQVDFDRGCLRLADTKTGPAVVTLGAPALELLASLPHVEKNPHVLTGAKSGSHFVGLPKVWRRVRERAGLSNVRLHDLRHSFASVGAVGGESLLVISKLLGHAGVRTSERYSHLADDPVRAAADRIAGQIARAMTGGAGEKAEVVPLERRKL